MTRRLAQSIAAVAALQLAVGLCAAAEPRLLLTGSDDGVWLVRVDEAKRVFDIALRKKDGDWKWLNQKLTGRPVKAVAGEGKLHVMFTSPLGQLVFDETGTDAPALKPEVAGWPDNAAPLAMCQWQEAGSGQNIGILAVVPSPAGKPTTTTSAPATGPSSAPARPGLHTLPARSATAPSARGLRTVDLGIFLRLGPQWENVANLFGVTIGDSGRVLATTDRGRVYLMISDPGRGPNRLVEWYYSQNEGVYRWRDIPLAGSLAADAPLAMVTIAKRVVVVLAGSADTDGQRQIVLAEMSREDSSFSTQTMLRGEKPATWPVGTLPEVTRMGDQLALLWQDPNGLAFGKCGPRMGQLIREEGTVDVFEHAPAGNAAQELITNFVWVVMVSVFAAMVLLRPRGVAPEMFVLPPAVKTGHLGKRLLAGVIDLGLCYFIVGLIYTMSPFAMSEQEMTDLLNRMWAGSPVDLPIDFAIMIIATLLAFAAYSAVMEIRTSATLGKMLMRLRVVGTNAKPADLRQCVIRNLTKIVELVSMMTLVLLPLVPMIVILTRYNQRIGDLLARTAVVDAASLSQRPAAGEGGQESRSDGSRPDAAPPPLPPDQDQPDRRNDGD